MRSLKSKKEEAKKRKRNQIIIGITLVIVMFGSVFGLVTLGFDNSDTENEINYKGYEFVNQGNYWYLTLGDKEYMFQYNPFQVEESFNLTTENLKYLSAYSGAPLYISSLNSYNAELEIGRVFTGVALRIQKACLDDNSTIGDCPEELPIKDCSNNFIIIREGEEEMIYKEGNCVFIEGSVENLIKLADDYLFRIMGIKSQI